MHSTTSMHTTSYVGKNVLGIELQSYCESNWSISAICGWLDLSTLMKDFSGLITSVVEIILVDIFHAWICDGSDLLSFLFWWIDKPLSKVTTSLSCFSTQSRVLCLDFLKETCLLLEGEFTVTPDWGELVKFGAGDIVVFPSEMDCRCDIHKAVRKHYRFGD